MKNIAEVITINQQPTKINDYIYQITEKYIVDARASWESFMIDKLYEFYEKEGFTKVLLISKKDYKAFLEWAIPLWKERMENDK